MGGTNGVITNSIADTFASNDIKNQCLNNLCLKLGKVIDLGKVVFGKCKMHETAGLFEATY